MPMTSMLQRLSPEHRSATEEVIASHGEQWVRDNWGGLMSEWEYIKTLL